MQLQGKDSKVSLFSISFMPNNVDIQVQIISKLLKQLYSIGKKSSKRKKVFKTVDLTEFTQGIFSNFWEEGYYISPIFVLKKRTGDGAEHI